LGTREKVFEGSVGLHFSNTKASSVLEGGGKSSAVALLLLTSLEVLRGICGGAMERTRLEKERRASARVWEAEVNIVGDDESKNNCKVSK
jgi:hypothetical protein